PGTEQPLAERGREAGPARAVTGAAINEPRPAVNRRYTTLIIAGLAALGPFSIDTYFPSFPALAAHFGVTEIQVQCTLSFYLAALAGMNLFHGSLSDSFGRRRVILVSLGVYTVTALGCVVAPSFTWLLGLRVIQGLAGGAGMIVSRALIRDCFAGAEAQKFMAEVTMVSGLGPAIAPILGGWLHVWFGWRGPFLFLSLLGAALWCACQAKLPESLPRHLRHSFHPGPLFRSYLATMSHPGFLLLCLALGCGGGGFLLYVATASVSGLVLGAAVSGRFAGVLSPARFVKYGFSLMALGAALNIAASLAQTPRVPWAVLPLSVYTFGFALLAPVVTIQGLDVFPEHKGLASSLQGFSHVLIFALIAGPVAPLVARSGFKHALGLALLMFLSWLAYYGSQMYTAGAAQARGADQARRDGGS
ncbi:MAG: multidrug effflux MFS transporter, partial [Verrucomicrobia bacterium]|nr:multidrug effflux MFS transporter [Verrucomicrobiota bacterium]